MAKEDTPGFLSKVARFVRNPLTNWADLDQAETDKDGTYSKAMLKEMIERKRRNDFVRKREFDQLRKLRSRGMMGFDPADRHSFFQSSLPSSPDERNATLKKIDEIEAQMSQQWWKSKPGDSGVGATSRATQQSALPGTASRASAGQSLSSAVTEASQLRPRGGAATAPTVPMPVIAMKPSFDNEAGASGLEPAALGDLPGLSRPIGEAGASEPTEPGFVHDPELEEAAIRFANGDYEGAEAVLQALLAPGGVGIERSQTWLTLFDLYRATGQHDRFDSIAIDFAHRFGRSAPVWIAFSDAASASESDASALAAGGGGTSSSRGFSWSAPDALTAKVLSALATALLKAPEPWRMNWARMQSIEDDAIEPLLRLVTQWSGSRVQIRFAGADRLLEQLADATPASDRTVNPLRWRLRMEMLRLTGRADDFDLTALDYCITYEVSPPSWNDSHCQYQEVSGDGVVTGFQALDFPTLDAPIAADSQPGSATGPQTLPQATYPTALVSARLAGQLLGDVGEALASLEHSVQGGKSLTVRCDKLARIDFSAAGSVLNWVAARHAEGCDVQFTNVQRLVAVFFNIIGINEYARVTARQN